jgi:hypothetical protein
MRKNLSVFQNAHTNHNSRSTLGVKSAHLSVVHYVPARTNSEEQARKVRSSMIQFDRITTSCVVVETLILVGILRSRCFHPISVAQLGHLSV